MKCCLSKKKNEVSRSKTKAFSLVEVVITVGIISCAVILILRSFTAVIAATKLSQNISRACLLAENRLFWVENNLQPPEEALPSPPKETDFTLTQESDGISDLFPDLKLLLLNVSWQERKNKPYSLDFLTYLFMENE